MTTKLYIGNWMPRTRGMALALALGCALLTGCGDSPQSLIKSAKDYQSKNDHAAAIIQLRNALQQDPNIAEARFMLASSLLVTNDDATAEKELRKAMELGYAEETVVPLLARAMVDQGRGDDALKEFGARPMKTPEAQASLQTTLGDAYAAQNREKDAKSAYAAALAAVPGYIPARVGEVRLLAVRGEIDEATRLSEEIMKVAPEDPFARSLRATLYVTQKQYKEAADLYAKMVAAEPNKHSTRRAYINALILDNQLDAATAAVADAKKAGGGNDARLVYQEALLYMRKQDYAKARDLAQQVLRLLPDDLPTLLIAGGADLHLGNYEPAQDALRRVVERVPQHDGARRLLIGAYLRSGQATRAIETMRPLLERPQVDSMSLSLAGEVYLAAGDLKKAEEYLARAAKLDKDNVALRTRLGQLHLATGDAAAIEELESASAADASSANADLLLVLGHTRRKEYDKANAALAVLEKKQPNNPVTFNVKGTVLASMGDTAGARAAFDHALELKPDNFAALVNLARLDVQEKRPDIARNRFEASIAKQPSNEQLMLTYAQFLSQTGAPPETVLEWADKAVKANPNSESAHLTAISLRAQINDKKAMLSAAQNALAAMPNSTRIMEAGGLAQMAAGDVNQAISTFNKLAQAQPKAAAPLMRLAQAQVASKDYKGALESLRKAQTLEPGSPQPRSLIVDVLAGDKRYDEALVEAKKLQTEFPQSGNGLALEGDIYAAQKKWKDAERAYTEALKREAENTMIFAKTFRVMELDQRGADADAFGAKWVKAHPSDANARIFLAERELQAKNYKAALTHYKVVMELQPKNVAAMNNLAWVAGQVKDPAALQYAQQAYELAPNNPAVLDTLGMTLVDRGEIAKGLPYIEQAFKLAPKATEVHFNYAKTLAKAGKKEAAKRELEALAKHENEKVRAQAAELLKTL